MLKKLLLVVWMVGLDPILISFHTVFLQVLSQVCHHWTPKTLKKRGELRNDFEFLTFWTFFVPKTLTLVTV